MCKAFASLFVNNRACAVFLVVCLALLVARPSTSSGQSVQVDTNKTRSSPTAATPKPVVPPPVLTPNEYLTVVRRYVDAMLEHGRDRYGQTNTPLLAAFLKLDGATPHMPQPGQRKEDRILLPPDPVKHLWGYRTGDRMWTAANVMHDQNLYQLMYALAKTTREKRYADEADGILRWFFEHCQSAETGLLGWGEHLGYDLWEDRVGCSYSGLVTGKGPKPTHYGGIHEFYRSWALWPRSFELAPAACERFARGLWDHQIHDQNRGFFSRHAYYGWHGPGGGAEFPRHGGFYIATWAEAYQRTKDPVFLKATEVVVKMFLDNANPQTKALPAGLGDDIKLWTWPFSDISLAIDLHDSASRMPEAVANPMLALAKLIDQASVKVPNDLKTSGKGFVIVADVRTLQPGTPGLSDPKKIEADEKSRYSGGWKAGYGGAMSHAKIGMVYYLRHRQSRVPKHREWALDAAETYMGELPVINDRTPIYPITFGESISLLLAAHELSGEARYLDQADRIAALAVQTYFAHSPIPRVLGHIPYYESITGPDTLAMSLLKLWAVRQKAPVKLDMVWTDR